MTTVQTSPLTVLERAADRCADALLAASFRDGSRAGWVSWALAVDGAPSFARGGDPTLYSGDAGAAWACAQLGVASGRDELVDLGRAAMAHAAGRPTVEANLLSGSAGVALARGAPPARCNPDALPVTDLTAGLAGVLLAQVRGGAGPDEIVHTVRAVQQRAEPAEVGVCWTDPVPLGEPARPLCGLAHGASGVALALAEAAAATGDVPAARTAGAALCWERLWFDPLRGWPDRRAEPAGHPAWWCHGAAGIGAVRLRILELVERGTLDVGIPAVELRAEAEAAVGCCLDDLDGALTAARDQGAAALGAGLTLCHGAGGALDLLVSAAQAWNDEALLARARTLAAGLVSVLQATGDDPSAWPNGLAQPGDAGLLVGLAGVVMVLTRLVHPGMASAGLLPGAETPPG